MKKSIFFMFLWFLMMTIFISINNNNMFYIWLLLEINMMMFIPLMKSNNTIFFSSMIKYFIIQSIGSSLLFLSLTLSYQNMFNNMNMNILVNLSMIMKLGMFPFHMWLPQICEGMSWASNIILLTMQKFIPLFVMSFSSTFLMTLVVPLSAITGSMGMFYQNSIRKLLAFSSISHMAWMSYMFGSSSLSWLMYFIIYSLISFSIFFMVNKMKINSLWQMKKSSYYSFSIILSFLSLAGLPPLLGFLPKWMVIFYSNYNMILFILIMSSLINIYTYSRLLYPSMINSPLTLMKFSYSQLFTLIINNSLIFLFPFILL
uniref:NADH dehydrogenase subunit 2 n=1 Tax=Paraschizogynium plumachela TaxID=3109024 RepID=UPI002E794474|nr:NADH dehydrogenase subunit 2 [Paraschizogynium plumachela]WQM21763.1 NADH dehydrogenase subunit 2 [Paraschizogynium plumachela]